MVTSDKTSSKILIVDDSVTTSDSSFISYKLKLTISDSATTTDDKSIVKGSIVVQDSFGTESNVKIEPIKLKQKDNKKKHRKDNDSVPKRKKYLKY